MGPGRGKLGVRESDRLLLPHRRLSFCRPKACSSCGLEEGRLVGAECEAEVQSLPAAGLVLRFRRKFTTPKRPGILVGWGWSWESGGGSFRGWKCLAGKSEEDKIAHLCQRKRWACPGGSRARPQRPHVVATQDRFIAQVPGQPGHFLLFRHSLFSGEVQTPRSGFKKQGVQSAKRGD